MFLCLIMVALEIPSQSARYWLGIMNNCYVGRGADANMQFIVKLYFFKIKTSYLISKKHPVISIFIYYCYEIFSCHIRKGNIGYLNIVNILLCPMFQHCKPRDNGWYHWSTFDLEQQV